MKVLVCGGRNYRDRQHVFRILDDLHETLPITEVVQGGAPGADFHAKMWARERGILCTEFKADWAKYGNDAGPIRNLEMDEAAQPDLVVAFPGGGGTANMVSIARRNGRQIMEIPHAVNGTVPAKEGPGRRKGRGRVRPSNKSSVRGGGA